MTKRYFVFGIGFLLCLSPLLSGFVLSQSQKGVLGTLNQIVVDTSSSEKAKYLDDAKKYNESLYSFNTSALSYEEVLNLNDGLMAALSIPKINLTIPIYHGISETVLSKGAGHVPTTSLPIGQNNSHCVLIGHRGLPGSSLFTRLDELENEDIIFIEVLNETLAYEVDSIEVVLPEEAQEFEIQQGQDRLTLVTCTPYGINSHRLLVHAHRVPFEEGKKELEGSTGLSLLEKVHIGILILFLILFIFTLREKVKL